MLSEQAMKLDANALFSLLFDTYGVPYREIVIVPQTDEDKARSAAKTQAAAMQGKIGIVHTQADEKRKTDDNQAENRMLIETGKHTLKQQGAASDHQNDLELQQKQFAQTPEAQGLDRAAKGAFATADKAAF
jgi:hypothetical protein